LNDKEQQIENDKDVGGNKEAKKNRDIQNERRRLNYLQSDSERETQNVSTTFSWKGLINVIPIYLNSCTLFLNRSGER
jgi:hypothetical protein